MNTFLHNYHPATSMDWDGRNDGPEPDVQRWHQRVQVIDLANEPLPALQAGQKGVAIIGFICDEGVRRNLGRVGAKSGPQAIRKASASLPVHFGDEVMLIDAGDIYCEDGHLEKAQKALVRLVDDVLKAGYQPLIFGGGHEIVYGHYQGLRTNRTDQTIGVINFDAHFDLREPGESGPSSGTPFWQIAQDCKASEQAFRYLPIGIQQYGNTRRLFATADELKVDSIRATDWLVTEKDLLSEKITEFIDSVDAVYLTIDLDVFAASAAPGVSAINPTGFMPDAFFFNMLNVILKHPKLISMDIAELNPAFDTDNCTARLAATLAFQYLSAL